MMLCGYNIVVIIIIIIVDSCEASESRRLLSKVSVQLRAAFRNHLRFERLMMVVLGRHQLTSELRPLP